MFVRYTRPSFKENLLSDFILWLHISTTSFILRALEGRCTNSKRHTLIPNILQVSLGNPEGQRRIVDPTVLSSCSQESLSIVISLTTNCISPESENRPSFEDVLWNLQYAAQVQATSDGNQRNAGKTILSP